MILPAKSDPRATLSPSASEPASAGSAILERVSDGSFEGRAEFRRSRSLGSRAEGRCGGALRSSGQVNGPELPPGPIRNAVLAAARLASLSGAVNKLHIAILGEGMRAAIEGWEA